MNLSKKAIGFVISLATIGLVGLAVLQVTNLNSSIKTNEQIFDQKVELASGIISDVFTKNLTYAEQLRQAESDLSLSGDLNDDQTDELISKVIDKAFEQCGLDIAYEYAVYKHKGGSNIAQFSFVLGDQGSNLDIELPDCVNPQEMGHAWANVSHHDIWTIMITTWLCFSQAKMPMYLGNRVERSFYPLPLLLYYFAVLLTR